MPMWRPYGWSGANHMKYHMYATWVPILNPYRFHMTPIWVVGCKPHEIPHVYHIVFLYRSYVVCTWSPIWANHMGSTWVPHDTHMWFTTVKPIWAKLANHMYATWVTYGSSMWHPYGWSGANHMKFHTFTILSSYIDPIWTPYDVGLHCCVPGMATTQNMYITGIFCSNQIKYIYFRQLHVQHFLNFMCKVKQRRFSCTDVTVLQS